MNPTARAKFISEEIGTNYRIPPPPTVGTRIAGNSAVTFTHFRNMAPGRGLSRATDRDPGFIFNVPMISARYPVVSINGRSQSVVQDPGKIYLFDRGDRTRVSLETIHDSICIMIPQDSIEFFARDKDLGSIPSLRAREFGQPDAVLYHLALATLPALKSPSEATAAFVEYLAIALHEHVIHAYAGAPLRNRKSGGLAPWQIKRVRDFVEQNLSRDISIAELSADCRLSCSHFARAFQASLGMTPHQWMIKRRLERAKALMSRSDATLAEVAAACGFSDQSHLGRHFLRHFGTTPARWRLNA